MIESSAILINNIYTNGILENCISSIIYEDISDHFAVFLQTRPVVNPIIKPCSFYKRTFTEDEKSRFMLRLQKANWNSANDYDVFFGLFSSMFNECFPLRKFNTSHKKNSS